MPSFPKTERGLRSRITRYRAALSYEKRKYGAINDGAGMRYVIFWLLLLLDDPKESNKYIRWYRKEFVGDIGEPIHKLCLGLIEYRMGNVSEASYALADLMLTNQHLIPELVGLPSPSAGRERSNYASKSYVETIPVEIVGAIAPAEKDWIAERYSSLAFRRLRKRYSEIERELARTEALELRKPLVRELFGLLEKHQSEITANQPLERTPPRRALRRRSTAR